MKDEDRKLLLKDLSARFPYNVALDCRDEDSRFTCYLTSDMLREIQNNTYYWEYKPYLFPLSSMTEEQKEDLLLTVVGEEGLKLFSVTKDGIISNDEEEQSLENFCFNNIIFSNETIESYIDWLNANNFDYRGLIPIGLAIDCTNLNIY